MQKTKLLWQKPTKMKTTLSLFHVHDSKCNKSVKSAGRTTGPSSPRNPTQQDQFTFQAGHTPHIPAQRTDNSPRTRPAENCSSRAVSTLATFFLAAYFLATFLERTLLITASSWLVCTPTPKVKIRYSWDLRRVAYPCLKARWLRNTEIRAMQRKQGWKLGESGFRKKKKLCVIITLSPKQEK